MRNRAAVGLKPAEVSSDHSLSILPPFPPELGAGRKFSAQSFPFLLVSGLQYEG